VRFILYIFILFCQHCYVYALPNEPIKISGFIDLSMIYDIGTGTGDIPGRSFDGPTKQDGFNFNIIALTFEQADATSIFDYHIGLLLGSDANRFSSVIRADDFAVNEAYLIIKSNNLSVNSGIITPNIGYEVFPSKYNINYSRSYGFFLEPLSNLGFETRYEFNDILELSSGFVESYSNRSGSGSEFLENKQKSFLAGINLIAPNNAWIFKNANLNFGLSYSYGSDNEVDQAKNGYLGGNWHVIRYLNLGFSLDYRELDPTDFGPSRSAWAWALYSSLELNDEISLHSRTEWAKGTEGTWSLSKIGTNDNDHFIGVTVTLQYDWLTDLLTRAELRWDQDLSSGPQAFNRPASQGTTPDDQNLSLSFNTVLNF
jgi:hypothetical protein